jgi:hypothetical protein
MNELSRRQLLSALMALAGAAALPIRAYGDSSRHPLAHVTSLIEPKAQLAGQRYLQLHGSEADIDVLADLLCERIRDMPGIDWLRDLSRAVQEDFEQGHVVLVDGWMLSRTEVRVCALAWLSRQAT